MTRTASCAGAQTRWAYCQQVTIRNYAGGAVPVPTSATPGFAGSPEFRRAELRARRTLPRPAENRTRGRLIHGPPPPGGSTPSDRTSDLSPDEVAELAQLIADGRLGRHAVELPARLRARSWTSVEQVLFELERRLGWTPAGWKVGAGSMEGRRAEKIPSPSPGRIS